MTIHTQLRQERLKQGLTIRKTAELMGCAKDGKPYWGLVQKIEKGGNVQFKSLEKMANALGKSILTTLK